MPNITIYSAPKCGTHYLMQVLAFLTGGRDILDKELYRSVPLVRNEVDLSKDIPIFAALTSEIKREEMRGFLEGRYALNMYRHPLDVTISRYFNQVKFQGGEQPFGDYFQENFLKVAEEVINHHDYIQSLGGLNLCYEYCLMQPHELITGMATLLDGVETGAGIDADMVKMTMAATSIDKAKASERAKGFFKVNGQDGPFYRDGSVFQYQNYFDAALVEEIKSACPEPVIKAMERMGYAFEGKADQ